MYEKVSQILEKAILTLYCEQLKLKYFSILGGRGKFAWNQFCNIFKV